MHDPYVVVFEFKSPLFRRVGPTFKYHRAIVTVWHVEPKGHDSGSICKGMRGSGWSWANVKFALRHIRHLEIHVEPYRRVKRWLLDHCAECGYRFRWKQARHSYQSSPERVVYHEKCMDLRSVRGWADDLEAFIKGDADDNCRWRVDYRLHLNLMREAEQIISDGGRH